jgi:hypothetical protein
LQNHQDHHLATPVNPYLNNSSQYPDNDIPVIINDDSTLINCGWVGVYGSQNNRATVIMPASYYPQPHQGKSSSSNDEPPTYDDAVSPVHMNTPRIAKY